MRAPVDPPTPAVGAYLARQPPEMRATLERLRSIIRSAAPDAEEVFSYQMPAFRQNGMLVYYAGFSDHGSFFIASVVTQRKFAKELKPFAHGKGTTRFTPAHPLPAALVRRIVRARLAENLERQRSRHRRR